jgi:hypothetical protein
MSVANFAWFALGVVIVIAMGADALETLISTRIGRRGPRPTTLFYRFTWRPFRALALRARRPSRRESLLAFYAPMSFVGLLAMWTMGQILGWACIWRALGSNFDAPITSFSQSFYYSGVVYFTVGFGDVLPSGGLARTLTMIESFTGLGIMGLLIGYLPSLNGAYQARERKLLLLDDLTDARITPMSLVQSLMGPDGSADRLESFFFEWAEWSAEVFESHSSFPVLAMYRSQHPGQSWVTALGVVTDAAITVMGFVDNQAHNAALRMYRQGVRTMKGLADQVGVQYGPYEPISFEFFAVAYELMQDSGLTLLPIEQAWPRINELRAPFHPVMEAFIDATVAPPGFWGPTSAVTMTATAFDEAFLAAKAQSSLNDM